jgi:hypothetical protein
MIVTIFGKPGAGKSTIAACFVQMNKRKKDKYYKRTNKSRIYKFLSSRTHKWYWNIIYNFLYKKKFYDVIYSTDPTIQDTVPIDYENLGKWQPTWNSCLILEEAGIGLSSREYSKLSKYSKRLAAMHRHSGADILLISQTVDIDKAYRQRSQLMYIASKLGPFTLLRRITYSVDVDENTHDLVDAYAKVPVLGYIIELLLSTLPRNRKAHFPFMRSRAIIRRFWYKYFDSFVDDFDYPMLAPDVIASQKCEAKIKDTD